VDTKRYWTERKSLIALTFVVLLALKTAILDRKSTKIFGAISLSLIGLLLFGGTALAEDNRIPKEPPVILAHTPDIDATQIPINSVIAVVWDRPMQPDTNFMVTGPEGFVQGEFRYDDNTYTVTFVPQSDLVPDTRYGVLVAGQIDIEEQVQQTTYQWNFSTVTPTSVSIASFGSNDNNPGQSWWWTSWPWLMAVISLFSLAGFLFIWNRRRLNVLPNQPTP
jgi:hypothetical protein